MDKSFEYFKCLRNPFNHLNDTPLDNSRYTLDGSLMDVIQPPRDNWSKIPVSSLKYVDDYMGTEHLAVTGAYNVFTTAKTQAIVHARDCQEYFTTVKTNAEKIGMTVND